MMGNWDSPDNGKHLCYKGIAEKDTRLLGSVPVQCRSTLGLTLQNQRDPNAHWLKLPSTHAEAKERLYAKGLPHSPGILPASTSFHTTKVLFADQLPSQFMYYIEKKNQTAWQHYKVHLSLCLRWKHGRSGNKWKKLLPACLLLGLYLINTLPTNQCWSNNSSFKNHYKKDLFR